MTAANRGEFRTVLGTLGAISGNRTYSSRLRLLFDYIRIGIHYALVPQDFEIRSVRCAGFPLAYRHARSLYTTFKEVFVEEDYYFEGLPERPFILDCGANIGMATVFFKRLRPAARVVAIEPSPTTFALLVRNLSQRGIWDAELVEVALSDREGWATLREDAPGSASNRLSSEGGTRVQTIRLSSLINCPVDLLKLDVEGTEELVLKEIERSGKLDLVQRLVLENHLNPEEGTHPLGPVLDLLERNGFRYAVDARSSRPLHIFQSVNLRAWRAVSIPNRKSNSGA
jgi:FkbM family methyltransferase